MRKQMNWEVWSKGDRWSEDMFSNAFKDKGEALRWIKRLKRSHPYEHYYLKHRRSGSSAAWSSRAWKRRNARMADRWRDRRRSRRR